MSSINPVDVPLHPAVAGVMSTLPHPGEIWPRFERQRLIAALEKTFDLIYKDRQPDKSTAE